MTTVDTDTQRNIANRLKRAQGQLGAVIAAVESGGDCRAVVTQLAAVTSALDKAGFQIIASAMKTCLEDPAQDDAVPLPDLEKLFLTLA